MEILLQKIQAWACRKQERASVSFRTSSWHSKIAKERPSSEKVFRFEISSRSQAQECNSPTEMEEHWLAWVASHHQLEEAQESSIEKLK